MIKYWQSMHDYLYFLTGSKVHFDSSERNRLHTELWEIWQKLRLFDTGRAMEFLLPFYSATGRPAKNRPQILRSFLLFFLLYSEGLARPSLTLWVERLSNDRVPAAPIGCTTDSLPLPGSCFGFMDRLWTTPVSGLYARDKLLPASRNRKKPDRPRGRHQKAQETKQKITESIEKRLMAGKDIPFSFGQRLQQFFCHVAVLPSMECGPIPDERLTVSGDGTAVHTHACPSGHHRDGAPDSLRHFPGPDAARGWDSGLDKYYFGYTLFQLSCYNRELRTDIPLLLRFTSARRHDSVSFPAAFHELEKHMPAVSATDMCLDSAMDNYPAYRILKKRGIRAFTGPNDKYGRPKTIPDTITIDKDGTPLCQEKLRMKPNGYDKSSGCLMWRCPYGKEHCSKCKNSCMDSKYGRVVKTRPDWDIRLYTGVPRGTDAYKKIYKQRTATERINNRILNDYGLHRMFIHTKEHYSFMTTMIGICIHLDARYKQQMQTAA